ncbi:MAG: hypothetical protein IJY01_06900 [Clostridia bacterium]|nr:hypothetical protein [Clostridia bacterium]
MDFPIKNFRRVFSCNHRRDLRVRLAEMSFTSDLYDGNRGDLYPVVYKRGEHTERWGDGTYTHTVSDGDPFVGKDVYSALEEVWEAGVSEDENTPPKTSDIDYRRGARPAFIERFFASLSPFATYRMTVLSLGEYSEVGFTFFSSEDDGSLRYEVLLVRGEHSFYIVFNSPEMSTSWSKKVHKLDAPMTEADEPFNLEVSLRPGAFDIYVRDKHTVRFICSFGSESFKCSNDERAMKNMGVALHAGGNVRVTGIDASIDCGLGLADMRSVRYENSEVMVEGGKVYFTASIRRIWGTHQGVFSWVPGTSEIDMVGALFFDAGDGVACDDVATSLIFNRMDKKWYLNVASFSHGHIVGSASFENDVRFGVNTVDIRLMPLMKDITGPEDELWLGKDHDEDPDLMYDEDRGKWLYSICRHDGTTRRYRYHFFESDYPDRDFKFVGKGMIGEETGGSIMKIDGTVYFICGNKGKGPSDYRVYKWGEFDKYENLTFDYPDGGFRGWGTIMPIKIGTRERYFHLTFDRVRMSSYDWSYGNIYLFEADSKRL